LVIIDDVGINRLVGAPWSTADVILDALWILNPKIKDDVPIRKETAVRILPVRPGTIASGAPVLVCGCSGCSCCPFVLWLWSSDSIERNVNRNVSVNKEKKSSLND
jgi:hypothetical protein